MSVDTDNIFYRLFREHPDWLREFTGLPLPDDIRASSQVLKQLEIRCDLVLESSSPLDPCYIIEFQFYHDHSIFNRAELAKQLLWKHYNSRDDCRRKDFNPRLIETVVIFGSRSELPAKTPDSYPLTQILFFDELLELLGTTHPESPLLPTLLPLCQSLNDLENEAHEHYHSIRSAKLAEGDREILVEIFLNILLQRFKTKNRDEIRAMIAELTPIKETRVGQELLEEGRDVGRQEGRQEGRDLELEKIVRAMSAKGKSASEISELTDTPIDRVEKLLSSR